MNTPLNNKILNQAVMQVESQLQPKTRADYEKVLTAGLKAGLQGGPKSILASLAQSQNPVQDAATGAINLVTLLYKESRGTIPLQAMIPAAMSLMLHALDFADRANIVKVGSGELVEATKVFSATLVTRIGVSKNMLHTASAKIHGMTKDPAQMERLNREAGVVKSPNASTPTPLPGAE